MRIQYVDAYGHDIVITIINCLGEVVDVSTASSMEIHLFTPGSITPIVKAASFVTDGTDGKISYTIADGDFEDGSSNPILGRWKVRGQVTLPGPPVKVIPTEKETFEVVL